MTDEPESAPGTELVLAGTEVHLAEDGAIRVIDTGEEVKLPELADGDLARAKAWLRMVQALLRAHERDIDAELTRRMDARREWTIRAGGHTVKGKSPQATGYEWDAERLRFVLERMASSGRLEREPLERCFKRPPEEVVVKGVNAVLAGATKREQNSIRACRRAKPTGTRSVGLT